MLEVLLGLKTLEPVVEVEEPEIELEPVDVMPENGSAEPRKISLRLARAIVNNIK